MNEQEATATLADLIGRTALQRIDFIRLQAERIEGAEPVGPGLTFPTSIQVQISEPSSEITFRVTVSVQRPDLSVLADAVAIYKIDDSDVAAWRDEAVLRVFGGRVAVAAVIPIARAKIRELTNDMGILPVLLGLYDAKPLPPSEEENAPPISSPARTGQNSTGGR